MSANERSPDLHKAACTLARGSSVVIQ